ncbi:hypothetical protein H0H93_009248, partial [Arthromyces matolae]
SLLDQAFTPPPSKRQSIPPPPRSVPAPEETVTSEQQPSTENLSSSGSSEESWKAAYESQVEAWRAQSSEARVKAEKERERWEAVRATEKKEHERRKSLAILEESRPQVPEHESVPASTTEPQPEEVLAQSNVEVPIETQPTITSDVSRPQSQADTGDESQKWEHVNPSLTSSYPSLEYPERGETPPPSHRNLAQPSEAAPLNATLAIFDSTLSTRTRVKAVFSSLAINLFLPFVNGVMLGFGEIFAKNVVLQWFGWKPVGPGYVAASAGIGSSFQSKAPWGERR